MSTFTNKDIIRTMLDNNGTYPGDPQADSIWEYRHSATGKVMWAVFYPGSYFDLDIAPNVEQYIPLWTRKYGHMVPLGALEDKENAKNNSINGG